MEIVNCKFRQFRTVPFCSCCTKEGQSLELSFLIFLSNLCINLISKQIIILNPKQDKGGKILKATGVVRRIDDLGRIVIPKEIRRTLRIKEGDPLEIFTDKEGEVILKKYSPIGELSEFATGYAETLSKTTGHIACITDKDSVIAVSGGSKKEFLEQSLSPELEKVMENKEVYTSKENNEIALPITQNDNKERRFNSQVIYPIISDGDVIGSVILLSKEQNTKMGDTELKVVQSAAGFLSSQMDF